MESIRLSEYMSTLFGVVCGQDTIHQNLTTDTSFGVARCKADG
jgi:hypothetical protein